METEGKNEEKLDFTHIIVHQEEIGDQNTELKVVKGKLYLNVGFETSIWFKYIELDLAVMVLPRKEGYLNVYY